MLTIAVGSLNPVKIAAAESVWRQVAAGEEIAVRAVAVPSGVRVQPWGDEEMLQGARRRARAALQKLGTMWSVGFEGGVLEVAGQVFTGAWCVVLRADGVEGIGGGASVLLPPATVTALRSGAELGPTMDVLTGFHNTKQHAGAIGMLTAGLLDRQRAYEHILKLALARFRQPQYYEISTQEG